MPARARIKVAMSGTQMLPIEIEMGMEGACQWPSPAIVTIPLRFQSSVLVSMTPPSSLPLSLSLIGPYTSSPKEG